VLALPEFYGEVADEVKEMHGYISLKKTNEILEGNKRQEAEQERQEAEQKRRDQTLQLILAVGTAIGLLFSWNQVEALSLKEIYSGIHADWSPILRFDIGVLIAILFVLIYVFRNRSSNKIK